MAIYASLEEAQQQSEAGIFSMVKSYLDSQVAEYSSVEVAFWPLLAMELLTYSSTGTVGTIMASYIQRGRVTATDLCNTFLPKLQYQNDILTLRDNAVIAIRAQQTIDDVILVSEQYITMIQGL